MLKNIFTPCSSQKRQLKIGLPDINNWKKRIKRLHSYFSSVKMFNES